MRQAKDAARRVYLANQTAERAKKHLEDEQDRRSNDGKSLAIIREEVGALHDENRILRMQTEEMQTINGNLQKKHAQWEQRQALEKKTSRFIAKHVGGVTSKQSVSTRNNKRVSTRPSVPLQQGAQHTQQQRQQKQQQQQQQQQQNSNSQETSFRKSIRKGHNDLLKSKAIARQKLDESIVNDLLTDMRAKSTMICPDLLPQIRHIIASLAEERELWRRMVAFVGEAC